MNNEKIKEAFDKLWELDEELQEFQITKNVQGRKLQLRIKGCGLYNGDNKLSPLGFYTDDYDMEGMCADSKWLFKFCHYPCDLDIYFDESDIPKELKTKLTALNKYLIKTFKDNALAFVQTYINAYAANSKQETFKKLCERLKKSEEEKTEKQNTVTLKLNDSYTASYAKGSDKVKVGCQTFSKDVILKLAAAIQ